MSEAIISVEKLSKRYTIQHRRNPGEGFRHVLEEKLTSPFRSLLGRKETKDRSINQPLEEEFWALKDVSFEVKRGEVVGIIGRNGAGKSTLLKVLSRITEPTEGRVRLRGRVASLLEVGTGFHPELTGRENVFLNGSILGMSKAEIKRKFDEIVAFSEVEKFLDLPVKRYSSGMYVRLAFAVAAHLEPEILIVDEVLAVGDAEFQKKCLGKMRDVTTNEGRTVLFVSHNMDAVLRLCSTAVMLNKGSLSFFGETSTAIQRYLAEGSQTGQPGSWIDLSSAKRAYGGKEVAFVAASFEGLNSENPSPQSDQPALFKFRIKSDKNRNVSTLAVGFFSLSFTKLINVDSNYIDKELRLKEGENEVHIKIEKIHLRPGTYMVGLWLAQGPNYVLDSIDSAFEIDILDKNNRPAFLISGDGVVSCDFDITQS